MRYTVSLCERSEIKSFIETYHYSHNINGVMSSYCFKLLDKDVIIGAMIFGKLGMANAWKRYADKEEDVLELRRLVLVDNTERNAESFFIGKALKYLKKNTYVKIIVSYADPNHGHTGIIYKASNFKLVGITSPGKVINWEGKLYHDKAIRTQYKGVLKPFAVRLKEALALNQAYYIKTLPKYIYVYRLK